MVNLTYRLPHVIAAGVLLIAAQVAPAQTLNGCPAGQAMQSSTSTRPTC